MSSVCCISVNEITTMESLQVATNNFYEDHKLGEGGFGEVYKICDLYLCVELSISYHFIKINRFI